MKTYSTVCNTWFAAVLVAALAGLVIKGLALNQKIVYEHGVFGTAPAVILPEIVVTARRLDP